MVSGVHATPTYFENGSLQDTSHGPEPLFERVALTLIGYGRRDERKADVGSTTA